MIELTKLKIANSKFLVIKYKIYYYGVYAAEQGFKNSLLKCLKQ